MTNYTTMSGAEFKRAVGIDPEKWAEAFTQREFRHHMDLDRVHGAMVFANDAHEMRAVITQWFRDYGEAVLAAIGNPYGFMEVIPTPERRREIAKDALARENDPTRGILD